MENFGGNIPRIIYYIKHLFDVAYRDFEARPEQGNFK